MRFIFIDPSINNIGVAVFTQDGDLEDFFEIKTSRTLKWTRRVSYVVTLLLSKFKQNNTHVVIEMPVYFSGGRGRYAYAGEKVQKLYYAVGAYKTAFEVQGFLVELVTVTQSRKNLPKRVSQRRVEKVFGAGVSDSEHVLDAIYLGMWYGKKHDLWDLMT